VTVHICRSHICDRRGQRLTRRSARPPHLLVHVACSADPEHSALTTPPHDPAITSVESRVSLPAHERLAMLKLKLALSRPHRPGLCIVRGVRGHGCRRLRLAVVRAAPALRPELRQGCRVTAHSRLAEVARRLRTQARLDAVCPTLAFDHKTSLRSVTTFSRTN
jgi:hypothetical protein